MPSKADKSPHSTYETIGRAGTFELKVKRSRFIAHAFPVENSAQCEAALAQLRRRFHDARHICFAYRLRRGGQIEMRTSDDGEPAGTAGPPMGQVVAGQGLVNVLVAVVRYFGGVKLGAGGLVRAYTESAQCVLDSVPVVRRDVSRRFRVRCQYVHLDSVLRVLRQAGATVLDKSFSQAVSLTVAVPVDGIDDLGGALVALAAGDIAFDPCSDGSE